MRFGKGIKNYVTGLYVIGVLLVLPVTLFIPALALAQLTNINLHVINAVCVCVCVIYTMLVSSTSSPVQMDSLSLYSHSTTREGSKPSSGPMLSKPL